MINLRRALHSYLKTLHPRVYFQEAPENAIFPYIVYDITNTFNDGEYSETPAIDIDGWDKPIDGDTNQLESLMSTVNSLNKHVLTTDDISVVFYILNKIPIQEEDKRIKRRKYIYNAKLFERS